LREAQVDLLERRRTRRPRPQFDALADEFARDVGGTAVAERHLEFVRVARLRRDADRREDLRGRDVVARRERVAARLRGKELRRLLLDEQPALAEDSDPVAEPRDLAELVAR